MQQYSVDNIRNVCLIGHGHAGKTSLAEAMLLNAGIIDRMGKVSDGTATTDHDPEEIRRKVSVATAIAPFEWNQAKVNILDTPGYFDFVGEQLEALRVADSALIVVSGKSGVSVGTELAYARATELGLAKAFFVNKLDADHADFEKVLDQLREVFGKTVAPLEYPLVEDGKLIGYVNVINMHAHVRQDGKLVRSDPPAHLIEKLSPIRDMLNEAVASTDDALMEKFFNDEPFTDDELKKALRAGIKEGTVTPVYAGSATENVGILTLLDAIVKYLPSPDEGNLIKATIGGEEQELPCHAEDPFAGLVFKTVADPYVGKISYIKAYAGSLKADQTVLNVRTGEPVKMGKLFYLCGKKQIETASLTAGDIGAVGKLPGAKTGDTLCSDKRVLTLPAIEFPEPVLSMAILPKAKGDEEKISAGLTKLMDEDPSFKVSNNKETKQMLVSGVGEQHLDVITSKLKSKFGVEVELIDPRVAYRETLRKKVKVEGKHKKQSGGHGQFGHVWIEFEPSGSDDFVFEEKIFGGSVPKNYFPAVEKGLLECIQKGVLAGYPVVGLKATLVDGSYHPVDSSEMAFKIAAGLAYKKGLEEASPVLLEPIGRTVVTVPEKYMGDIIGDLNKRRGQVLGMEHNEKGLQEITAEVPMAEMHRYATDLRSITQGIGKFTLTFERYQEAPPNVAEKVIAESKAE